MDSKDWTRVGLLTLAIEYFKTRREYDRLKALKEAAEAERAKFWAEREAAWEKVNQEIREMAKRTEEIEIK